MQTAKSFFSQSQQLEIQNAIKLAELNTSGEIRVHIENTCKANVLDRAATIFSNLKMHKTALRNGVLFYLAVQDKKFAILGDAGINTVVAGDFWDSIKSEMTTYFANGKFSDGLIFGIGKAGEQLQSFFPFKKDEDINELSDTISFGKD